MKLTLQPTQKLSQTLQLILSPRLINLLKTLNLPYVELIDKINKEANENPLLEIEKPDELLEYAKSLKNNLVKKEADYDPLAQAKEISAGAQSLTEYLYSQLRLENLEEIDYKIGQFLIDNIDDQGFLTNYSELREEIMQKFEVKRTYVDKTLKIIQTLEPDGICARSLKECLLIQAEAYNFENEELKEIITKTIKNHLENLAKKKYSKIADDLGIPESGIQYLASFIEKNLNPAPASGYQKDKITQQVIPSFIIEKEKNGTYKAINLEQQKGPRLNFSQSYLNMLDNPKTDSETKRFLKEKFEAAKELIEHIKARHETTQKIINIITNTQEEFFQKGIFMMKPLLQKSLAEQVGVHPSTISRAVSTKYAQTPQGFYPLKFLCPRNYKGYSSVQIKGIMKTIIEENPKLSDLKICAFLQQRGIGIKRRTVAKYRSALGLSSSYHR